MKIVVNRCYGGFGLSPKGIEYYLNLIGKKGYFYLDKQIIKPDNSIVYMFYKTDTEKESFFHVLTKDYGDKCNFDKVANKNIFYARDIARNDINLIKTVEDLGKKAGSRYSDLEIVEIPDDVQWEIEEYDGKEWVAEVHRTW